MYTNPISKSFVFVLLIAICFAVSNTRVNSDERKPNIIFILADDMGWMDTHCYGHPYAQTPNIDKLAAEGTRYQQCYATGVTCCPSRTGIMTSWSPARYPTYPANGGFAERVTITELLKKKGYSTGHFGKWHIGPDAKPGTYGIDTVGSEDGEESDSRKQKRQSVDSTRGRDAHVFDQAINFIEKHKEGPFYVNIWDHIPHNPVNPSQAQIDAFGPLQVDESKFNPLMQEKFANCKKLGGDVSEHMRAWLAEIKTMDAEIGNLMQRLDKLGLSENTIVVFTSDQGPETIRLPADADAKPSARQKAKAEKKGKAPETGVNPVRLNAMGYTGPLRGGKHGQLEGGVRIPFIVRWPGHVKSGRVDEESVVSLGDWLPTLCAITGIEINASAFDGEDTSKAWLGKDFTRTKPLLWKTSAPNSSGAIRLGDWKLHDQRRGEGELYNVVADPGETKNLADKEPDKRKELSTKLDVWLASLPKEYVQADDGDK